MSTHKVEVVPVVLDPHGNADTLSVVRVWGFTCVVRTADFKGVDHAAYLEPDTLAPVARPEFTFLANRSTPKPYGSTAAELYVRIKCARLRGVMSMGLLVRAPDGAQIGDDVAAQLGVLRYEPPIRESGDEAQPPRLAVPPPVYGMESLLRYQQRFAAGESVFVTEKIHGANARYVYAEDRATGDWRLHAGSHRQWKKPGNNPWWRAAEQNPLIERWCRAHPGYTLYGEVYGDVQDLRYGHRSGEVSFAVFDILDTHAAFLDYHVAREFCDLQWVHEVAVVPYDFEALSAMADGLSMISRNPQIREGIVVRPTLEQCDNFGRLIMKVVSPHYLERA